MSVNPLVSVIIPVYNVKQYLRECVESICGQTYNNLEIIVVDDGSTDGSGELSDNLCREDNRVVVFHKENGGLSDARNFGLRHAHGQWISFVDSDDYVSPVFIESLLDAAVSLKCQVAAIPVIKRFKDGGNCRLAETTAEVDAPVVMSTEDVQRNMLYQVMDTAVQNRLYKRDILDEDPFPKGLYYEDLASVYRIIRGVDCVAVVDCQSLYAYRQRSSSILHQKYRHEKAESALQISAQLYRDIRLWYPKLTKAASSRCFSLCRMVYAQVPIGPNATEENECDRSSLWSVLKSHCSIVCRDSNARFRERLAATIACAGEPIFSIFCSFCRRIGWMR